MITVAQSREAERLAQLQRLANGRCLVVVEAGAGEDELALAKRVRAAAQGDGASFDKALGDRRVDDLFQRGILAFQVAGT